MPLHILGGFRLIWQHIPLITLDSLPNCMSLGLESLEVQASPNIGLRLMGPSLGVCLTRERLGDSWVPATPNLHSVTQGPILGTPFLNACHDEYPCISVNC